MCDHKKTEYVIEYDWDGEPYEKEIEVFTFEDLDLHRYQCQICGAIGYYSGPKAGLLL